MKCTDKERETCNVEKMGCEGCYYNENKNRDIEELKTLFYSGRLTQHGKRKLIEYYEQQIKELKDNSIPVSLVEEITEKLKEEYELLLEHQSGRESKATIKLQHKIEMCEELLEKRK